MVWGRRCGWRILCGGGVGEWSFRAVAGALVGVWGSFVVVVAGFVWEGVGVLLVEVGVCFLFFVGAGVACRVFR
jgi:hypothetical protein